MHVAPLLAGKRQIMTERHMVGDWDVGWACNKQLLKAMVLIKVCSIVHSQQ